MSANRRQRRARARKLGLSPAERRRIEAIVAGHVTAPTVDREVTAAEWLAHAFPHGLPGLPGGPPYVTRRRIESEELHRRATFEATVRGIGLGTEAARGDAERLRIPYRPPVPAWRAAA